jgi:hypothetical protein
VGEVLVEGGPRRHAGLLEFNHHPRQSVDETHQVRSAGVERTGHAELAHQQEVVAGWVGPVDYAQALGLLAAVHHVGHGDGDAVLQQRVNLPVGGRQAHRRAVAGEFVDGAAQSLGGDAGVKALQRRAEAAGQHHLAFGLSAERGRGPASPEGLVLRRHRLPAQRSEQPDGGLLDELVFGVGVGGHLGCGAI